MRNTLVVIVLLACSLRFVSAATVTGKIIGTDGHPIKGASVYLTLCGEHQSLERQTDAEGSYTVEVDLASRQPDNCLADIVVYAPGYLLTGSTLEENDNTLILCAGTAISGTVVNAAGNPLAGIPVRLRYWRDRTSYHEVPAAWQARFTDHAAEDGTWKLPGLPKTGEFVAVLALDDDRYVHEEQVVTVGAGERAAAVHFTAHPCATVSGKVCNAAGKPVQGATVVSVEGGLSARTITDDAGAFTLANQPLGDLHLLAATSTGGGLATYQAHEPAIICTSGTVADPTDIPLALQWLDADKRLPEDQRRFNRTETLHQLADLDLETALRLAMIEREPVADGLRAYLLGKQAEQNPAKAGELLVQLNLLTNTECKFYAAIELGIAVAPTDQELAERLYLMAKEIYDRPMHDNSIHNKVTNGLFIIPLKIKIIEGLGSFDDISLRLIALAGVLHKTANVDAMLAPRLAAAKQTNNYNFLGPLFEAAGRVSPEFVFTLYDNIDFRFKRGYLDRAVLSMALHDPAAALRLIDRIDALHDRYPSPISNASAVVRAFARKDPAAALMLVTAHPAYQHDGGLCYAAAAQPKEMAHTMLLDYFAHQPISTITDIAPANAADPDVAKALYARYKAKLQTQCFHFGFRFNRESATTANRVQYASLISSIDPVEARLILETGYADAISKAPHNAQINELGLFPQAMCAIDLNRAREMLKQIHSLHKRRIRPYPEQQLMRYILMTRAERVSALFF